MEKRDNAVIKNMGNRMMTKEEIKTIEEGIKIGGLLFIETPLTLQQFLEVREAIVSLQEVFGEKDREDALQELSKEGLKRNGEILTDFASFSFQHFKSFAQLQNIFQIGINGEDGLKTIDFIRPDKFEVYINNGKKFIECYFVVAYIPYLKSVIGNIENSLDLLKQSDGIMYEN